MFWTLHLIGWLSPLPLVLLLDFWSAYSFGPYFFVSAHLLCCKGWSLKYSPGWGNPLYCIVALYVGESERDHCTFLALAPLSVTSPATYKQIEPFWCLFPGGWTCVYFRTLGVSPTNSTMRLAVSPSNTNTTGFYSQRFWGFSFLPWNPGLCGLSHSPVVPLSLSTLECGTTWSASRHLAAHPLCPSCPSLPFLPVWMNVFNSLGVGLPYSSIFWQFWLFFVLKFVVVFLLFVQGSKAYLSMPPSWSEVLKSHSFQSTPFKPSPSTWLPASQS